MPDAPTRSTDLEYDVAMVRRDVAELTAAVAALASTLAPMATQLGELHEAGVKLSELSEQLEPMMAGLAGNPMLKALGFGRG